VASAEPITHRLLGPRLQLHTLIRLGAAALLVASALIGRSLVGIENLDVRGISLLALFIVLYDMEAWFLIRPDRGPQKAAERYGYLLTIMHATVVLDFLALTVAAWLLGGIRSPFIALYLVHVMLTCILLSPREAIVSAVIAFALLSGMAALELTGALTPRLPEGLVGPDPLDFRYALVALTVYALLLAIVAYLLIGLSSVMRTGEAQLRAAYAALERLSGLRRDFLDIAVHNIKAPLGAVTMFLRNLHNGLAGPLTEQQGEWVDRSLARLTALTDFMSDLRLLATLETGGIEERMEETDLVPMLLELSEEWSAEAEERGIRFAYDGPAQLPEVRAHERLLREAVANFLSNAMKFTPEGGKVTLRAETLPGKVRLSVEDTGVGISLADQGDLFREFQRMRPADTAGDGRRGSGIGLSIVKRISDAHSASLGCHSAPGQGSTFFIELDAPEA
jgi:signal transduction histidine kinase